MTDEKIYDQIILAAKDKNLKLLNENINKINLKKEIVIEKLIGINFFANKYDVFVFLYDNFIKRKWKKKKYTDYINSQFKELGFKDSVEIIKYILETQKIKINKNNLNELFLNAISHRCVSIVKYLGNNNLIDVNNESGFCFILLSDIWQNKEIAEYLIINKNLILSDKIKSFLKEENDKEYVDYILNLFNKKELNKKITNNINKSALLNLNVKNNKI